jgi:hypothetical protein
MTQHDETGLTGIFIAATVREAEFVEKLLESEGIEYDVRPEAFMKPMFGSVCLQGVLFEVRAGQAEYCRRLLKSRGLERGLVEE